MRINTYRYREWKKHQNEKNLRRRTRRKKRIKSKHISRIKSDRVLQARPEYNSALKAFVFKAPAVFSIVENPAETISFFNRIIYIMTKKKTIRRLFIDIKDVTSLRIEALMYLLAIMNNHNKKYDDLAYFSGNEPTDITVRKKFEESGFYNYVHPKRNVRLNKSTDNLQIVSGRNCDTETAKSVANFVSTIANVSHRKCSFIYNTMIELMSNTHKHAYIDNGILVPIWYCFVEYDGDSKVYFTFMDTGRGIPTTVQKNFAERLDVLGIIEENKYVISALNGEFRTATRQGFRGKGLPKIREYSTNERIMDLHIVSNKAYVEVFQTAYQGNDLEEAIQGTLYYWSIDLNRLRGYSL